MRHVPAMLLFSWVISRDCTCAVSCQHPDRGSRFSCSAPFLSTFCCRFAAIHAEAPEFVEMSVEQEILVTGIKVVDLLAPYAKGGKIGTLPAEEEWVSGEGGTLPAPLRLGTSLSAAVSFTDE